MPFVNTASTAGGDGTTDATAGANRAYASSAEGEAAEQGVLSSPFEMLCSSGAGTPLGGPGSGGDDTSRLDILGWTTDSTNTITWKQNPAGAPYTITDSVATGTILPREDYVTLDGLKAINTATGGLVIAYDNGSYTAADNENIIKNCWSSANGASSSGFNINASRANLILSMYNTIVPGNSRGIDTRDAATATIDFCDFLMHSDQLGIVSATELTCKNTYVGRASGSQQDFWTGGAAPAGSNNTSSDTTATTDYTGSQVSKAPTDQFTSITEGSEDFTLKVGSDLIGFGVTVSGITTDIVGTSRGEPPDGGAYEFVPVVTGGSTAGTLSLLGVGI